jgi:hypothetical protein
LVYPLSVSVLRASAPVARSMSQKCVEAWTLVATSYVTAASPSNDFASAKKSASGRTLKSGPNA